MSRFFYKFPVKRSQDFLGSILNYSFFILGLEINDAIYPKNIAAAIPPADAVIPPVNAPIIPDSLTPFIAPFARLYPKPVNGTVAPAPAKSTRY